MRCAYWLVEIIDVILPFHLAFTEALKKKKKKGILLSFEIDLLRIRLNGINWPFF
jgi:hypothetical protein